MTTPRRTTTIRRLLRSPLGVIGLAISLVLTVAAVAAPRLAPFDPTRQSLLQTLKPPGYSQADRPVNLMGTDHFGRDVRSRVLFGLRFSLIVAASGSLAAGVLGSAIGLVAGANRGLVDTLLMRLVDLQLSIPFLLIAVMWVAFVGNSMGDLVVVVALFGWVPFARVVRDRVLTVSSGEFVSAAEALGASRARVLWRHLAPQVMPEVIVVLTFTIGRAVVLESSLGFLGLSIPPPTPTLGGMVSESRNYLYTAWWLTIAPGTALLALVLGASFAGDALRDVLDPKLRR